MRTVFFCAAALPVLALGCGGDDAARVKGRLVENGNPKQFPPTTASVQFSLLVDGKPDPGKSFSAVVNGDGSFEVLASGGKLPPGTYQVEVQTRVGGSKGKGAAGPVLTRRELKPGLNEITIDLAKPEG